MYEYKDGFKHEVYGTLQILRHPFKFLNLLKSTIILQGAYNLFDPAAVEAAFYPNNIEQRAQLMTKKLIFYCEFSQKRAPSMYVNFKCKIR